MQSSCFSSGLPAKMLEIKVVFPAQEGPAINMSLFIYNIFVKFTWLHLPAFHHNII